MGPRIEHGGTELHPIRRTGEGIGDQEALYRKHLAAATQDLRTDLLPLVGSMLWPVPMLDFRETALHYPPEGHPSFLTIETPAFTPVVAPVAATVVQVDSTDPTDRRDKPIATVKLHTQDTHMTIVLKDLLATTLPEKLRDSLLLHSQPGIQVEEGELLGHVGRVLMTLYPNQSTQVRDNRLRVMMAYQPRGPSEHFNQHDTVDPLPFFHPLYEKS